jgi:hypothetical protein
VFAPFAQRAGRDYFSSMRGLILKRSFTAAGLLGLLAGGALAAPQAAIDGKTGAQTNAPVAPSGTAPTPQPVAPIGGAFATALTGGAQRPSYFGPRPTVLGGWFSAMPLGGTFQAGPIGGMMTGQNPPGGRLTTLLVGGVNSPGLPSGGVLSGRPPGGQFGSNSLGGIRAPNTSFTAGPGSVIVGGAQTAGASPGGVIVSGTSLGGVLVGGPSPNTNTPGGRLTNAPGGQLH